MQDARREKSLDVVKRVLDWRDGKGPGHDNEDVDQAEDAALASKGFGDFRPETAAALSAFVEAVIRDYVKWWYSPIVPTDESFPDTCRQTLTSFLRSISTHLSRKRPADTFLDFLANSSSIVIVFLNELSNAFSASQGLSVSPAEAIDEYLLSYPDSSLATVLNEKQQKKKFKMIADDILENFLDKPAFDCNPVRTFLKEMLASVVMEMSLNACSKPEWINGWIVDLLDGGEPEFAQAIDAGMGSAPSNEIDRNSGNVGFAKSKQTEQKGHRKRLSKAEEAMEEAMEEAKRLSQLIAEEDMRRFKAQETSATAGSDAEPLDPLSNSSLDEKRAQLPPRDSKVNDGSAETGALKLGSDPPSPKTPTTGSGSTFTSFDQIVPPSQPTAFQSEPQRHRRPTVSLTLHNAEISVHDDSTPGDKGRIRSKPSGDYWIQVEPKSSQYPGWMLSRKYADFETLHEVLRRIANVSGVAAFTEQHSALPDWRTHTKASLRGELERYLRDACWHQLLAESEGMKRFLEKDQGNTQSSGIKGIGWPTPAAFENMGKGMLDVLTGAPKGAAEGGKAVLGGMTGALANISSLGQRKKEGVSNLGTHTPGRSSTSTLPKLESPGSLNGFRWGMDGEENLRTSPIVYTQPARTPPMERKASYASIAESDNEASRKGRVSMSSRSSMSGRASTSHSRDPSRGPPAAALLSSPTNPIDVENLILPPPPSDIPDDYGSNTETSSMSHSRTDSLAPTVRTSTSTAPSIQSPSRPSLSAATRPPLPKRPRREATPLSEQETRVAVELLFAIINELYTLSSAWNIRRTLLNAAKTFLLRPGNPSLTSIQSLMQDSVIASNTSDNGIATHLRKLRETTMPTEEELKAWPPELTPDEKEKLRFKARKLLVERGMPTALTGVMGQVATAEAMGKVFDCLQVEEVSRGLIFGLLLQGLRAMTQ